MSVTEDENIIESDAGLFHLPMNISLDSTSAMSALRLLIQKAAQLQTTLGNLALTDLNPAHPNSASPGLQMPPFSTGDISSFKPFLDGFSDMAKEVGKDQLKGIFTSLADSFKDSALEDIKAKLPGKSLAGKFIGTISGQPDGTLTKPFFVKDVLSEVEGGVSDAEEGAGASSSILGSFGKLGEVTLVIGAASIAAQNVKMDWDQLSDAHKNYKNAAMSDASSRKTSTDIYNKAIHDHIAKESEGAEHYSLGQEIQSAIDREAENGPDPNTDRFIASKAAK